MIIQPHNDELDAALAMAPAGSVIVLPLGVSETAGNWTAGRGDGWCNIREGVRIVGQGPGRSIIRLAAEPARLADGVLRADRDLTALWCGPDVQLEALTVDANERAHRASGSRPPWYTSAIRKHGNIRLRDVTIQGLRGDYAATDTLHTEIEVFALSGGGDVSRTEVRNVVVQDCAVSSYVSGLFPGGRMDQHGRGVVADCIVDLGRDNQFAFSAQDSVTFRDCHGSGGRYGFYNDTLCTVDVELLNLHLAGSHAGICLVSKDDAGLRRLVARGGEVFSERLVEVVQRPGGHPVCDVLVVGVQADTARYVAAVDNAEPCVVRIQDCILADNAVRFRTKRSPEPITRSNWRPSGATHNNNLKTLVA
jgi:hypothetical protein